MDEKRGRAACDRLADWSQNVKIKAGWICRYPGCGELDRELLESHHKKPRHLFPKLQYDIKNGECLCLWHHAVRHRNEPVVRDMILARLGVILYLRHHRQAGRSDVYRKYEKEPSAEEFCIQKNCPARQIFVLWSQDVQGLSIAEIAKKMKTTEASVKSLVFRIRHRRDFMRMLPKRAREHVAHLHYDKDRDDEVICRF